MALLSDAREIRLHFGPHIEEVQQILRANQVDFGTPFDLPALAQALETNPKLREDLTDLANSILKREKNVSLRTVLNIIAIATGGPQIATTEEDISEPINSLGDFVIGTGSNSTPLPQNPESLSPESANDVNPQSETIQAIRLAPSTSDQETHMERSRPEEEQITLEPIDAPVHYSPSQGRNVFADSLTRLELNALEMNHYLDSIDQRISRMEPRLEDRPTYVPPPSTQPLRHPPEERYSAVIATESIPYPRQEEPLPPQPIPEQSKQSPELHKLSEILSDASSDSDLASSPRLLAIPAVAMLAAVALALLFYWSAKANTSTISTLPVFPTAATGPTSPPIDLASSTTAASAPISENDAHPLLRKPDAGAPPVTLKGRNTIAIQHKASSSEAANHPSAAVKENIAVDQPAASIPDRTDDPSITTTRPINVSSGVMAANVLSAPQPAYPRIAKLAHMQGEVVMQAIVSREGTIENVHVIKGHHLLRGAATNAVRTWRFRPFMIGGRPVRVATIVSVDFNLER
jgi:TonB family protein